jgi:2-succinyl-5-enolpyruvyl-6-hydroxy-3-cyclohexene-1-carboxylate synthase
LAGGWSETPREWAADSDVLAELIQDIHAAERPLVLFGRLSRQVEITAATAWLKTLRCPVYLDVTSSLKGVAPSIAAPASGQAWEWLAAYRPDCVIQFGQRLVTKSFDRFFGRLPPARFWCFSRECQWQDAAGCGLRHEQVNLGQLLVQLGECDLAPVGKALTARSAMPATAGEALSWPIIVEECLQQLPAEMPLMLGNSQTIRAFDEYDWSAAGPRRIFANRGVSGIEGLVSTTVGLAEGAQQPITVVLGDVSLIHDLNALLSVAGASQPVTVIVVNDGGGGIFQRLPIARYPEITDPLMTTPHGFEFSGLANMAGILYQQVTTRAELQAALSHSKDSASRLVEVVMPSHGDSKVGR